jgi:hypothetical protein
MRCGVRRSICVGSLGLREWIVGAARLSFEISTLLDGKAVVENFAFHMRLRLERDTQALDRSDKMAAYNYILGRNTTRHLRIVAEQK